MLVLLLCRFFFFFLCFCLSALTHYRNSSSCFYLRRSSSSSSVLAYLQKLLPQIDYSTLTTFLAASHDHHFNGFCLDSILSSVVCCCCCCSISILCDCNDFFVVVLPGELQTRLDCSCASSSLARHCSGTTENENCYDDGWVLRFVM